MANTHAAFPTVRSEGGLLPPDLLSRIVSADSDLGGITPEAYGLDKGLRLGEATARAWARARTYWAAFRASCETLSDRDTGVSETREQWILPLLRELGYGRLEFRPAAEEVEGKRYAVSHQSGSVPVHVVSFRQDLDQAVAAEGGGRARQAAHALVQEYLNRTGKTYGLVTNGRQLRLLRANLSLTRLSYVEFDLAEMLEGGVYADFALFYLTLHRTRLPREGSPEAECWLERWRDKAETQGARALGELRGGVEKAIAALGTGFLAHPANEALRSDLRAGVFAVEDYYRELLRLIYRFLFLFVAEERDLLQPPDASAVSRRRYREHYAASRLRDLAGRLLSDDRHDDLWQGLAVTFDLLSGRRDGLEVAPLGGGLFGRESLKHLEACRLSNAALAAAVRHLSFVRVNRRLRRVNYRDIDTEELGGVYESLLERQPHLAVDGAHFELVGSGARKQTGSYYTPSSLVQELIKSALEPVIAERLKDSREPAEKERAILAITVCDSACGSGHFLLAAARRLARELAVARAGDGEPTPVQTRQALRDVIRCCIYGVDLNPLAVDLCQLGLWLEGHQPGLPLSFLDHRIRCGNSLVGATPELIEAGIPDGAYDAVEGDVKAVASEFKKRNKKEREGRQLSFGAGSWEEHSERFAKDLAAIGLLPEDSVEQVRTKQRKWESVRGEGKDWWRDLTVANLWTAAFFATLDKAGDSRVPTTGTLLTYRLNRTAHGEMVGLAHALAAEHRFFHWNLEFPEILARGGFDCVLGNPPWEKIKLEEQEFFSDRDLDIARAPNKASRRDLIEALPKANPALARAFSAAKRGAEGQSKFVRGSGRFPLTAVGDINLYAIFTDEDCTLLSPRGRCGLVVPTGIATDNTTRDFFGQLGRRSVLASLFDFENRENLFPGVGHGRTKFCLLTLAGGSVPSGYFMFFLTNTSQLKDGRRQFELGQVDYGLLNPNTRTSPVFRTKADATLTKAMYQRVPVLIDESAGVNSWQAQYVRMFDMSNDSSIFVTKAGTGLVPLYEGKLLYQFDHRYGTFGGRSKESEDSELPRPTPAQVQDPDYAIKPRYWVPRSAVLEKMRGRWDHEWLIAFRDIANATNERTAIFAALPLVGANNKAPLLLPAMGTRLAACMLGNLNSLPFDYLCRQKVSGSTLNFFFLKQFAVIPPSAYRESDVDFIHGRVLELTYTAWDLQPFAKDLGHDGPPFRWDEEQRAQLRAELDAYYAALYGVTRDELRYILDPADVYGPDFPGETFRVLKEKEIRLYGEYRTRRLVLEAWDRLGLTPRNRDGRYEAK